MVTCQVTRTRLAGTEGGPYQAIGDEGGLVMPSNRPRSGRICMYKTLCAAMIFVVGTFAAFAQAEGDQSPRSGSVSRIPLDVVRDLAPTGKLRAAINVSNIVLAQRDPAGGDPHGITVDLARELARRLDIPIELVIFESAGRVTEALKTSAWDVSFLAIEPVRAAQIA